MPDSRLNGRNTLERAQALEPRLRDIRRHIHANPELSFQERETGLYAAGVLSDLGYTVRPGVARTGVLAEIGGGRPVIVLRADMDALPIEEMSDKPYRSRNEGVMHACGHDVHTACALGAAMLLAETPPAAGTVRILLQPAEETVNDQGKSGATLMIEQGGTDGADGVIALHVDPRFAAGKIAVRTGALLAACDSFDITIRGIGSHGAYPETGVDAIVLATHVIQAMQTIVSRRKSALAPAVLTVGGIRSTTYAPNVLAEAVEITGTVRYFDQAMHSLMVEEISRACSIADAMGGSHELRYTHDTPALTNDASLVEIVRAAGSRILGETNVLEAGLEMGADDFSFLTAHMPGCYFLLGAGIDGDPRMLHSPTFDIDESAIPTGVAVLAESALSYLDSHT